MVLITIFFFQHLQIQENDITYVSYSFEAILNQVMYHLGRYKWEYGGPVLTSEGIQVKILVTRSEGFLTNADRRQ